MYKINNENLFKLQLDRDKTQKLLNIETFKETLNSRGAPEQEKGFCALMLGLYNYDENAFDVAKKYFKQAKDMGYFCVSSYYLSQIYFKKDEEDKKKLEKAKNLLQNAIDQNQRNKDLCNEIEDVYGWEAMIIYQKTLIIAQLEKITERIKRIELEENLKKKSRIIRGKNKKIKNFQQQLEEAQQQKAGEQKESEDIETRWIEETGEQDSTSELMQQVLNSLDLGLDEFFNKSYQEIQQVLSTLTEDVNEEELGAYEVLLSFKLYQQAKIQSNVELLKSAIDCLDRAKNNGFHCISSFYLAYIYHHNDLPNEDRIQILEKAQLLLEEINSEDLNKLKWKLTANYDHQKLLKRFQEETEEELQDINEELSGLKILVAKNAEIKRLIEKLETQKQEIQEQKELMQNENKQRKELQLRLREERNKRKQLRKQKDDQINEIEEQNEALTKELKNHKKREIELKKKINSIKEDSELKTQYENELINLKTTIQTLQKEKVAAEERIKEMQMGRTQYRELQRMKRQERRARELANQERKNAEYQKKQALDMLKKAEQAEKRAKKAEAELEKRSESLHAKTKEITEKGYSPLIKGILAKDENEVKKALQQKFIPKESVRGGDTGWHYAVREKHLHYPVVKLLCDYEYSNPEDGTATLRDQEYKLPLEYVLENINKPEYVRIAPLIARKTDFYQEVEDIFNQVLLKKRIKVTKNNRKNINTAKITVQIYLNNLKADRTITQQDIPYLKIIARPLIIRAIDSKLINVEKLYELLLNIPYILQKHNMTIAVGSDDKILPYLDDATFKELTSDDQLYIQELEEYYNKLLNYNPNKDIISNINRPEALRVDNICVEEQAQDKKKLSRFQLLRSKLPKKKAKETETIIDCSNMDLKGENLGKLNVTGVKFRNTDLEGADFSKVKGSLTVQQLCEAEWQSIKVENNENASVVHAASYTKQLIQKTLDLEQIKITELKSQQQNLSQENMLLVKPSGGNVNASTCPIITNTNYGVQQLIRWLNIIKKQNKYDLITDGLDILLSSAKKDYLTKETISKIIEISLSIVDDLRNNIDSETTFNFCDRIMAIVDSNNLRKYKFDSRLKRLESFQNRNGCSIRTKPRREKELPKHVHYCEIMKNAHAVLQVSENNSQKEKSTHEINKAETLHVFEMLEEDILLRLFKSRGCQETFKNILGSINSIGEKLLCLGEYEKAWDFYKKIKSKVNTKWIELDAYLLTILSHITHHWHGNTVPQDSYLFDWQKYRNQLLCHRDVLLSAELLSVPQNIITTVSTFTENMRNLVSIILVDCIRLLGPAPCKFCFLSLGSMSRGDMMPYSDVECAILLEKEIEVKTFHTAFEKKDISISYFARLLYLFEFKMLSIGEYSPAGFHLDSEGHPAKEMRLCNTATNIIRNFIPPNADITDPIAYSLFHAEYIDGNDGKQLFIEYQKSLQKTLLVNYNNLGQPFHQIFSIKHLEQHLKDFSESTLELETKTVIDIKKHIYCWLHYVLLDLAIYHNLAVKNIPEAIDRLANYQQFSFPLDIKEQIIKAIAYIHNLRIKTQTANKEQKEEISIQQSDERAKLLEIYTSIVSPIYEAIGKQQQEAYQHIKWRTEKLIDTNSEEGMLTNINAFFEELEINFLLDQLTIYDIEEQIFWLLFTFQEKLTDFQGKLTDNKAIDIIKQLSGMNSLPMRLDVILSGLLQPELKSEFEARLYFPVDHLVISRIATMLGKTYYLEDRLEQFKLSTGYKRHPASSLTAPFSTAPHASLLFTQLNQDDQFEDSSSEDMPLSLTTENGV